MNLSFANTRFSDLWISKHKALSKFVKESVAEDQSEQAVEPKGPASRMSRGLC
jgi:hypothetical protein